MGDGLVSVARRNGESFCVGIGNSLGKGFSVRLCVGHSESVAFDVDLSIGRGICIGHRFGRRNGDRFCLGFHRSAIVHLETQRRDRTPIRGRRHRRTDATASAMEYAAASRMAVKALELLSASTTVLPPLENALAEELEPAVPYSLSPDDLRTRRPNPQYLT